MINPSKAAQEILAQRRNVGFDTYDITVKQLVDMVQEDTINVSPDYQRRFVWDELRQSQLVESIFLGIPIPSLFLATNEDSTWEVIDGLQRITTLVNFVFPVGLQKDGSPYKELKLRGLEKIPSLNGANFDALTSNLKLSFMTRPIRITVLNDLSDFQVRFDLFERLNTGGITLHEQEIRNCVFQGRFNDFVKKCAGDPRLDRLVKRTDKTGRGNLEELVLKFFAYFEDRREFRHSVKEFLNNYMEKKTKVFSNQEALEDIYIRTMDALSAALPAGIARSNRPNSTPLVLFEAVTVGVADVIAGGGHVSAPALQEILDDEGLKALTTGATNSLPKLIGRIEYVSYRVKA
ncbi:DUF262 domain-containing protein [Aminobacter sp. P9b]|uniref:DUF262 domain-containing protein n=1 Tax=Aminobacter sp. P9b TaxID=3133697 RepID=UPI00324F3A65